VSTSFLTLLELLAKNEVDFVVVGGFAGVVYGCTYTTQDVDICCDFSTANLLRLQNALADFHPVHRMTPKRVKLALTEKNCADFKNLYLDTDIGQLDCLSFINGIGDFQTVRKNSMLIETEGVQLRILSINALIETKKAMGRPRDREAVAQLEAVKQLQQQKRKK
jgi:hypothetical protein